MADVRRVGRVVPTVRGRHAQPVHALQANLNLLLDYGWQALRDGGARQLVELLVTGYLALAAYLVFEICKASLVRRALDGAATPPDD